MKKIIQEELNKVLKEHTLDKVYAGCWMSSLEAFLEKGLQRNKFECELIKQAYKFFKVCEKEFKKQE